MRTLVLVGLLAGGTVGAQETDEDTKMGRRVQELLRAHQDSVFRCVAEQASPSDGEALLRVVVARGGQAAKAEILKADAGARSAAECVARAARGWDYTSLRAGDGDQVVFPLRFQPEAPGSGNVAIGARMTRHLIAKKGTLTLQTKHVAAVYVLGPSAVSTQATGELTPAQVGVFMPGALALSAKGSTRILLIEAGAAGGDGWAGQEGAVVAKGSQKLPIANGAGEVVLYLDSVPGTFPFAVDRMCAKKGVVVPRHEHTSDELLYIESGKGTTTLGAETLVVKADELITIPRATSHSLRVDQDLCAIQVYAPAGPEQRFKPPSGKTP